MFSCIGKGTFSLTVFHASKILNFPFSQSNLFSEIKLAVNCQACLDLQFKAKLFVQVSNCQKLCRNTDSQYTALDASLTLVVLHVKSLTH